VGNPLPEVSPSDDNEHLQMSFMRDPSRVDLNYVVEASDNLANWTPIASSVSGGMTASVSSAASVSESGGAQRSVTVVDGQDPATSPQRYLRLRVTRP
jgi:hypothetical protein